MTYILHILIVLSIYTLLALSLNVLAGYGGLLSLCHASFYGVGAYVTALLVVASGLSFILSSCLAAVTAALLGVLVGLPILKMKGDYFILATLAIQVISFGVLYNWVSVTRGPYGITDIPRPRIGAYQCDTLASYFAVTALVVMGSAILLYLMVRSQFGRSLMAVREDELAASALGKNANRLKLQAFVIAAVFASVAGSLFAGYMRYIDPTSFTLEESILFLSIIIVGGCGNFIGPIVGALFTVLLPELLRFLEIPDNVGAHLRQVLYSVMLVVVLRYRPQGLAGALRLE